MSPIDQLLARFTSAAPASGANASQVKMLEDLQSLGQTFAATLENVRAAAASGTEEVPVEEVEAEIYAAALDVINTYSPYLAQTLASQQGGQAVEGSDDATGEGIPDAAAMAALLADALAALQADVAPATPEGAEASADTGMDAAGMPYVAATTPVPDANEASDSDADLASALDEASPEETLLAAIEERRKNLFPVVEEDDESEDAGEGEGEDATVKAVEPATDAGADTEELSLVVDAIIAENEAAILSEVTANAATAGTAQATTANVDHPTLAAVATPEVTSDELPDNTEPALAAKAETQATAKASAQSAKAEAVTSAILDDAADADALDAADDAVALAASDEARKTARNETAAANSANKSGANGVAHAASTAKETVAAATSQSQSDNGGLGQDRSPAINFAQAIAPKESQSSAPISPEQLTGQSDTSSQSLIGGGLTALKGESALLGRTATTGFTSQAYSGPYAVNQVNVQIAKAVDAGDQNFTVRLDPPELGRVTVKLQFTQDGVVRAEVMADRRETLDMLRRDSRAIERALEAGGHKADSEGLSFSLDDGASQQSAGKDFAEAVLADRIDERMDGNGMAGSGMTDADGEDGDTVLHLDSTDLEAILPYVTAETGIDVRV